MRLTSIEISGFRGLREFNRSLRPDHAFLLFGLNGTGKSSLFQALTFGVTGQLPSVSCLEESPKHVYRHRALADAELAVVKLGFTYGGQAHWVERTIESRNAINCSFSSPDAETLCSEAKNALCFLTRQKFAQMVDAVDRDCWTRLSPLLGHEELAAFREGMRLLWLSTRKDLNHKALQSRMTEAQRQHEKLNKEYRALLAGLALQDCTIQVLLNELNQLEISVSGVTEVSGLQWNVLESQLPGDTRIKHLTSTIASLTGDKGLLEPPSINQERLDEALSLLREISDSPDLGHQLLHAGFFQSARNVVAPLIHEPCPVCGLIPSDWNAVRADLGDKADRLKDLDDKRKRIVETISSARVGTDNLLGRITAHAENGPERSDLVTLANSHRALTAFLSLAESRLSAQPARGFSAEEANTASKAFKDVIEALATAKAAIETEELDVRSEIDSVSNAKQIKRFLELQALASKYLDVCEAQRQLASSTKEFYALEAVIDAIQEFNTVVDASEAALSKKIIENIVSEVGRIFQVITGQERLLPKIRRQRSHGIPEASIVIEDFYGLGEVSAREFLSEANRNALGLSIFFAGLKTRGLSLNALILDDVTHSADHSHRRGLANFIVGELSKQFQILVFTHEKNWYDRLFDLWGPDAEGLKVLNWSPEGLHTHEDKWAPLLNLADQSIKSLNPSGGNTLRMAMEEFMDKACETYKIPIPYKRTAENVKFEEKRLHLIKQMEVIWSKNHGLIDAQAIEVKAFRTSQRITNLASHQGSWEYWGFQDLVDALNDVRGFINLFICKRQNAKGICGAMTPSLVRDQGNPPECPHCHKPIVL